MQLNFMRQAAIFQSKPRTKKKKPHSSEKPTWKKRPAGALEARTENRMPHDDDQCFIIFIYIACNILHVYMRATVKDGQRNGRGYSLEELKEADIDARTARKNGVPTDVWRKTKYPKNVEQLKSMAKTIKESPKDKPNKKAKKKKKEEEK